MTTVLFIKENAHDLVDVVLLQTLTEGCFFFFFLIGVSFAGNILLKVDRTHKEIQSKVTLAPG